MSLQRRSPTRGQSLVEFALLLPILLLIAVVLLDLGRGVYYYSVIYNAAREGARYGIVNYRDTRDDLIAGIISTASELTIGLDPDELTITPNVPAYPIETGDFLQVTAEYNFSVVTPLANLFVDGGIIELSSTSTMFFER